MGFVEDFKEVISNRYKSIREFSIKADIAYSTVDNILKRKSLNIGIDTAKKICKELNMDLDSFVNGKLLDKKVLPIENKDIDEQLHSLIEEMGYNNALMFDGEPLDDKTKELLIKSLQNVMLN